MGLWSWYFFAKGVLYFTGYIPLSVAWNLLFVAFLLIPTPERLARARLVVIGRSILHVAIALVLLWHDSWLPPLADAVRFVAGGGLPTPEFLMGFVVGSLNPWIVGALVALGVAIAAARRYVRLSPVVVVLLLVIGLQESTRPKEAMDGVVRSFLNEESKLVTTVSVADESSPAFDLVLLHVCSLSWEDLRDVGWEDPSFFREFDYLLTNFNSVTSHSTIAGLRLLRSPCGQTSQDALYRRAQPECYFLDGLRAAGYQTWFAMNHSGEYMGLKDDLQTWGHADTPLQIDDLPVEQYDFSGGPLRSDFAVLERWLMEREQSGVQRAALYYNTITLHIGGKAAGDARAAGNNEEEYRRDLRILTDDLSRFFSLLTSSGRDTVVLFVPEHGAALRGTKLQPAGLREIPLPGITNVPVAVKLVGQGPPTGHRLQRVIATPTSYRSLAVFVDEFLRRSPFDPSLRDSGPPPVAVPEVRFLAENEGVRVLREGTDLYVKRRASLDQWVKLKVEIAM